MIGRWITGIMLVLAGAMVAIAATLVTLILPPSFTSTARLVPVAIEPAAIATEVEKIRSKAVMLPVMTNLKLGRIWAERYHEEAALSTDVTYALLLRSTDIKQKKNTRVIEVTVRSEDGAEAAAIANEIVKVYSGSPVAANGAGGNSVPQIIDQATPSLRPDRPNRPLNIALGGGVGAILAFVGIWIIVRPKRRRRGRILNP